MVIEIVVLPPAIVKSNFFSEQLRQLAGFAAITLVDAAFYDERFKNIFQYYSLENEELSRGVYRDAAQLLQLGKVTEAWQVLLTPDVY